MNAAFNASARRAGARPTFRKAVGKGFTLVEILIVVIILGILAAIVIPQFANASNDARKSNMVSQLQTLRSQIALYSLQHKDTPPALITSWNPLIEYTDVSGTVSATPVANGFGPYMQAIPVNPLTNSSTVVAVGTATATTTGWYYNAANGEIHGANAAGATSEDGN